MASLPYTLYGTVYDTDGTTVLASIKVTARNERSNETITTSSASNGQYSLNAANFTSGYADGDIISVFVIYSNYEDYEEHVIVETSGGALINLVLVEIPASDQLRYFSVQDFFDFHGLTVGEENAPSSKEVAKVGIMVEGEIDEKCGTRFNDGSIEVELDDCDSTTGWNGSTDAVAVAVTTTAGEFKTRTGALDLGKSGVSQAFFSYNKSTLTSRVFTDKVVACWVYLKSLSTLAAAGAAVTIKYGSSGSNYYSKAFYKSDLVADWNLLFFNKSDREVGTTGVPVDSAMTYFEVYFTNTAASDVVTSGDFILDNVFLVDENHFSDEYLSVNMRNQEDFFLKKIPVDRMVRFLINKADENESPVWAELIEDDNEIKVDKDTGRVRIVDLTSLLSEGRQIYPLPGSKQVRATYIFGKTNVPRDVKKLSILMTAKDLMQSSVSKALMRGQDSFKTEHYNVFDKQIESILSRYRRLDFLNV